MSFYGGPVRLVVQAENAGLGTSLMPKAAERCRFPQMSESCEYEYLSRFWGLASVSVFVNSRTEARNFR